MSLRDYFASKMLAGLASSHEGWLTVVSGRPEQTPPDAVAVFCYVMADAMLAARTARPAPAEPLSPADTMRAHLDTFGGER